MHYTAGGAGENSAQYLFRPHSPSSSAHFVIGRDGRTWQLSGIDNKTWHAGKSQWKGISGLNSHAIGIEFANYGYLHKTNNPTRWLIAATNDKLVFEGVPIVARHKNGGPELGWEPYPIAQIEAGKRLTSWLLKAIPGIGEIVGHDDISPGRKADPGPAFPMAVFQALLKKQQTPAPETLMAKKPEPSPTKLMTDPKSPPMGVVLEGHHAPPMGLDSNTPPVGFFGPVETHSAGSDPHNAEPDMLSNERDDDDLSQDESEFMRDVSAHLHAAALVPAETPPCELEPPKPATQSLGIMGPLTGIIIAGVFQILGTLGLKYGEADVASAQHIWPQIGTIVALGLGSIVGMWGRFRSTQPIKGSPADPAVIERKEDIKAKKAEIKKL